MMLDTNQDYDWSAVTFSPRRDILKAREISVSEVYVVLTWELQVLWSN